MRGKRRVNHFLQCAVGVLSVRAHVVPLGAPRESVWPRRALPSEVSFKLHFVGYLIVYQGEARIHEGKTSEGKG